MTKKRSKRSSSGRGGKRGKPSADDRTITDDVPYTMTLPDGRMVFVLVPANECSRDVSGEIVFKPEAVRRLDRVQAMAMKVPKTPTPGFIRTLREALGLTQRELADRVGVNKLSVYRWERGMVTPAPESVKALDKLRVQAARKGIVVAA